MIKVILQSRRNGSLEWRTLARFEHENYAYRSGSLSLDKLLELAENTRSAWLENAPHMFDEIKLGIIELDKVEPKFRRVRTMPKILVEA